jgi:crossover junction endodeoxyribonuclease RusA
MDELIDRVTLEMTTLHGAPRYLFVIGGRPAPQGSKKHVGNGRMVEMSKYNTAWRKTVAAAVKKWIERSPGFEVIDRPLIAAMYFTVPTPASTKYPDSPAAPPDLSKYIRSVEDALKDAGFYTDDGRIVGYRGARKMWTKSALPCSLDEPGVVIGIWMDDWTPTRVQCPACNKPVIQAYAWGIGELVLEGEPDQAAGIYKVFLGQDGKQYAEKLLSGHKKFGKRLIYTKHACRRGR